MSQQMQAEIAEITGLIEEIEDPRESYQVVAERIREYRNVGTAIPSELEMLDRRLRRECIAASQGR